MNQSKAIWIGKYNEKLTIAPKGDEIPTSDQLQVKVVYCALNHADLLMHKGVYQETPTPPFVPGLEISGEVIAAGSAVTTIKPGDRVAGYCGHGGMAEIATVPAVGMARLPDDLSLKAAASLPVNYGTAWMALKHFVQTQPGDRLVVSGAAGATGLAGVELGAALGAEVIAIARGRERLAMCAQLGARHLIDPEHQDVIEAINALGKADIVFDTVGGDIGEKLFRTTKPGARHLLIGFASGQVPQVKANHLLVKNISLIGLNWPAQRFLNPDLFQESIAEVLRLAAQGAIRPVIDSVFALEEAEAAFAHMRARTGAGKVLIRP